MINVSDMFKTSPEFEVAPPLVMPPFKIGDILKLREFDGSVYKGVICSIDEDSGEMEMAEVEWGRIFFGDVKKRLEAGEVDYDYSETPKSEVPFTVIRHRYRPLEC